MMLLHFMLVLHFAVIVITFCVSITFCGDYYMSRRNTVHFHFSLLIKPTVYELVETAGFTLPLPRSRMHRVLFQL